MYGKALERFMKLKLISLIRDDDTIDQLHHRVATIILLVMAGFFSAKTKWGSIECWIPKEYDSDNFKGYLHQYCWISNLYRVPFTEELPEEVPERMHEHRSINFYRWVFLMFIVQALMFKIPNIVWRAFNTMSGINIRKVVELSLKTQLDGESHRDSNMATLAQVIDRWLKSYRKLDLGRLTNLHSKLERVFFCLGKKSGCFLTRLYLFVKLLYLLNILLQFQIISTFLHFNYWKYGTEVAHMLIADAPWKDTHRFPRVGMCDLEIRQLQNIQRHTVQCSLPINMFLEKAYAVEWFVLVILGLVTCLSLLKRIVEELFTTRREMFLNKYVNWLKERGENVDEKLFKHFVRGYLRDDGVFLMRLLTYNTGDLLTFDLLKQMWYRFKKDQHKSDDDEFSPETKPLTDGPPEENDT